MEVKKNNLIHSFFAEITEIPNVVNGSYFPSLDGFRGFSIFLVIIFHLNHGKTISILNGGLGVDIFFVISGFLITTLLLKEKIKTKTISLQKFYFRRFLRIFPVAYLYIGVVAALNYFLHLGISSYNFLAALLYLMNLTSFTSKYNSVLTQHYWSLSVEEQFYLIFPFLLKKYFKVYLLFILFIIFVLPLLLVLSSISAVFNNSLFYAFTHYLIKFQGIAVGCFFAILTFKNRIDFTFLVRYKILLNLAILLTLSFIQYDENFSISNVFVNLLVSFLVGCLILSNLVQSDDIIFKILNSKVLTRIGVLSYSIYIWQQLFTTFDNKLPLFMTTFPINLILLFIVAYCSYYFYEKKFLKLKNRYEPKNILPKPVL